MHRVGVGGRHAVFPRLSRCLSITHQPNIAPPVHALTIISQDTIPLRLVTSTYRIPKQSPIAQAIVRNKPNTVGVFLQDEAHGDNDESLKSTGVLAKVEKIWEDEQGVLVNLTGLKRIAHQGFSTAQDSLYKYLVPLEDDIDHQKGQSWIALLIKVVEEVKDSVNQDISNDLDLALEKARSGCYDLAELVDVFCGIMGPMLTPQQYKYILIESRVQTRATKAIICFLQLKVIAGLRTKFEEVIGSLGSENVSFKDVQSFRKELTELLPSSKMDSPKRKKEDNEADCFEDRLFHLHSIRRDTLRMIQGEITRFRKIPKLIPDRETTAEYLNLVTSLPWGKCSIDNLDLSKAEEILSQSHYGMEDVKKRILEFIAVAFLTNSMQGKVLCFSGPPGVGKTSICESIAKALNKKYYRIGVGSLSHSSDLKGHRRTYIASMPGEIITSIKRCGNSNPVILLDEIDKVVNENMAAALLDILDPSQNSMFTDSYVELPYDLSKVLFLTTANYLDHIPGPLKDRLEIIELHEYTFEEKLAICKNHIIPKILGQSGLTNDQLEITEAAVQKLIHCYSLEPGVRKLQQNIEKICRKIALKLKNSGSDFLPKVFVTPENLNSFLGHEQISNDIFFKHSFPVGAAIGMYYTYSYGGCSITEAVSIPNKSGKFIVTGNCSKSKIETAELSMLFAKRFLNKLGVATDFFDQNEVHLHHPDGARKKDGYLGGVYTATALLSLALNKRVKENIAMAGELGLNGEVLPVTGVRAMVSGALRNGIKTVILPKSNLRDWEEVPESIRNELTAHFVQNYSEVFELTLNDREESLDSRTLE